MTSADAAELPMDPLGSMCGVPGVSRGTGGLLLGKFGFEANWPKGLQVTLYLVGLLWSFLAVGIIADIFMEAIEVITSQERTHTHKETGAVVKVKVWNATVANLTLMALGSSAPEILLSVLEILQNSFFSGELGPSTIVGSAAFNMLVILAVCTSCLPGEETRLIADLGVYSITAVSSLFAYLWLIIILQGITPNKVDVWEGILTFLFFPVLVIVAFEADKGKLSCGGPKITPESRVVDIDHPDWGDEDTRRLIKQYKDAGGSSDPNDPGYKHFVKVMMTKNQKPSRAAHRINAVRGLTGGKRIIPDAVLSGLAKTHKDLVGAGAEALPLVQWESKGYMTYESGGEVALTIVRAPAKGECKVNFATANAGEDHVTNTNFATGGADIKTEGADYVIANETVTFADGEASKTVKVIIIDDDAPETDEHFFVNLTAVEGCQLNAGGEQTKVTIVDDDMAGEMGFNDEDAKQIVMESCGTANIIVNRHNGSKGEISCAYETIEGTAVAGKDFTACSGRVTFAAYQMTATIAVPIENLVTVGKHVTFTVKLSDAQGPTDQVKIFSNEAGTVMAECAVEVASDDKAKEMIDATRALVEASKAPEMGSTSWADQFKDALSVSGGDDDEEGGQPGAIDWIMHILTVPWKLFFATCAPTAIAGGWLCFFWALGYVGFVTALIGDLAGLFGCALGLKDAVTAITFVALGTSLPDTFASKSATLGDDTADAAIGNVTGSNSVNVFLGLGLPWMMASIYWSMNPLSDNGAQQIEWIERFGAGGNSLKGLPSLQADYPEGGFIVVAGDLGFSVAVFTGCSVVCIGTLAARRKYLGAELGGNVTYNKITSVFFVFLWFLYVALSSWKTYSS
jgi:solute carrier family 8 (sodium/calcium exchanger)